jgi:hypothetical protein
MKKPIILFLFAALALSGCRKQVSNYERPDFDPQPTLNAVLQKDQPVWAQVSFAECLDSVHPAPCTDAEVLLYVDGQFKEKLQHEGDGLYVGETAAEALHEYACKVIIPGYDTLFARTEMPEKPVVTGVEIMENATVDEEGTACPAIMISFNTNPDKSLYYQSSIDAAFFSYSYYHGQVYNSTGSKGTMYTSINTDDPVLLNEGSDQLLFSNEIITDTSYTLKVNASFNNHSSSSSGNTVVEYDSIVRKGYVVVSMSGISESCYHYRKSQEAYQEADAYTNLFLGVITPLNLYSNVENGRGVFAAIAPMTCDTVFIHSKN